MSLGDILGGVASLAGAAVVVYAGKELLYNHYLPYVKKIEKELESVPDPNDHSIIDKPSNYTK